jgi:hypothetical protein
VQLVSIFVMAIAMRYVLPLVLCQLVVPAVTGTRRLEKEDASAQGAMVNSTLLCPLPWHVVSLSLPHSLNLYLSLSLSLSLSRWWVLTPWLSVTDC